MVDSGLWLGGGLGVEGLGPKESGRVEETMEATMLVRV